MSSPPEPKRPPVVDTTAQDKEAADLVLNRKKGKGYAGTLVAGAFTPTSPSMGNTMGSNTTLGVGSGSA